MVTGHIDWFLICHSGLSRRVQRLLENGHVAEQVRRSGSAGRSDVPVRVRHPCPSHPVRALHLCGNDVPYTCLLLLLVLSNRPEQRTQRSQQASLCLCPMRRRNNPLHPDDRIRQGFWRNPELKDSQAYFLRRSDWSGGVWRLLVRGKPRSSWSHNAKGTLLAFSMIAHSGQITSISKLRAKGFPNVLKNSAVRPRWAEGVVSNGVFESVSDRNVSSQN